MCQVGEMKVPKQGQIEVNINGKLGKSPSDVQFTYQVRAFFFASICFIVCALLKFEVYLLNTYVCLTNFIQSTAL